MESARCRTGLPLSIFSSTFLSYAELCCVSSSPCYLPLQLLGKCHATERHLVSTMKTDRNSLAAGHWDTTACFLLGETHVGVKETRILFFFLQIEKNHLLTTCQISGWILAGVFQEVQNSERTAFLEIP